MYRGFQENTLPNYHGPGGQAPNKSLYGNLSGQGQYYADHDADEEHTQEVPWTLTITTTEFTDLTTGYEYKNTVVLSGKLAVAETSGTDNFFSTGPSWSEVVSVPFLAP